MSFVEFIPFKDGSEGWNAYDRNTDDYIGRVSWFDTWGKFVFEVGRDPEVLEADGLREVALFLDEQTEARRRAKMLGGA